MNIIFRKKNSDGGKLGEEGKIFNYNTRFKFSICHLENLLKFTKVAVDLSIWTFIV